MTLCLNPACNPPNALNAKFCMKCGTELIIQNRYKPLRELGHGGFGKTFLAVDTGKPSQPQCVIKQFRFADPDTSLVQKAKSLFYQEAQQLEKLGKHDQIPQLLCYCEQELRKKEKGKQENSKQEKFLYLMQDFVDGENLLTELRRTGAFNELKIRQLLVDLLPVLEFVHNHFVIHRDIKPENIMRRHSDQRLFLIDFGIAKQVTGTSLQRKATSLGTFGYQSPEQARGEVFFSSDLYSLGVSCFELLTNMEPSDLYKSYEGEYVWKDYLLNNPVQDSLGRVLDKMTQHLPRDRYQSAQEVLQALNPPAPKIIIPATPKVSTPIPATPIIQTPIIAGQNFTEDLGNRVQLEMIAIPGGIFQMGSKDCSYSEPIHSVHIKPFYLGKYPITQEQYQAVMGTNPSYFKGAKLPVESISWHDAMGFCKKLSQKTGKNYRLPSEAEWEYACRAGTQTKYHFGDDEKQLLTYAWFRHFPWDNSMIKPHPVEQKKPNQFGLYDMHGNVWEWCSDRWHENYNNAPIDGSSWDSGTEDRLVLRGGSSYVLAVLCRSASRRRHSAGDFYLNLFGFHVALGFA